MVPRSDRREDLPANLRRVCGIHYPAGVGARGPQDFPGGGAPVHLAQESPPYSEQGRTAQAGKALAVNGIGRFEWMAVQRMSTCENAGPSQVGLMQRVDFETKVYWRCWAVFPRLGSHTRMWLR